MTSQIIKMVGWGIAAIVWVIYAFRLAQQGEVGDYYVGLGFSFACALACAWSVAMFIHKRKKAKELAQQSDNQK